MRVHAPTSTGTVSPPSFTPVGSGVLQRKCACGGNSGPAGECAECRKKRLQRQRTRDAAPATAPPLVEEVLREPGRPLDAATRAHMEPLFGHDFSRVRVHTGERAAASAASVNAVAYTVGRDVVFGAGHYAPGSLPGKKLLAHELAHTIQQAQESSTGTRRAGTLPVGDPGDRYEREAEARAARVVEGQRITPALVQGRPGIARLQRWTYGTGTHHTGGGNDFDEVSAAERSGSNGVDASMQIIERLVTGNDGRAKHCQQWYLDHCTIARTLADVHNRAVIWMWRVAPANIAGLTDGGNTAHHANAEWLFNRKSRWSLAGNMIHEYWHDCSTNADADIGDDASAACGLPVI